MTRHMINQSTYGTDPVMEYRQTRAIPPMPPHDRSLALSMSRQNPRTDPMTRQTSRSGSTSQTHSTNSNTSGTPRRRIQVACGRCRKRKIRCSGDPGDNSGCTNCRTAGVTQGSCVFLRVQCEMRELVPDHVLMMSGYEQVSSASIDLHPYSSSSSASSSSSSLALGLPHPNMPASSIHHSLASQQHHHHHHLLGQQHHHHIRHHTMNPASMHNDVMSLKSVYHQDGGGHDGSGLLLTGGMGLSSHRGSYDGDMSNGTGGTNGMPGGDLYNGNFPQYLQPEIGTASSLMTGQQGQWSPLTSSSGRQANNSAALYIDQDVPQNYMPAPSSRMPSHASLDGYNNIFPALNSLSSSLPEGISPRTSLSDRVTLPSPFRTQQASDRNSSNDSTAYTTQQAIQPSGRGGYSSWTGGDSTGYSSTSASTASAGMSIPTTTKPATLNISPPLTYLTPTASQPIPPPALPLPPALTSYTNNSPIFPLSSSNSSLLPSGPPHTSSILNSSFDSFASQSLQSHPSSSSQETHKSHRSGSESSSSGGGANTSGTASSSTTTTITTAGSSVGGSKITTPAPTMRANPNPSPSYSPTYSRSSIGGNHDIIQKLFTAHMAD